MLGTADGRTTLSGIQASELGPQRCLFSPLQGDDGEVGPRGLPGEPVSVLTGWDSVSPYYGDRLSEEAASGQIWG